MARFLGRDIKDLSFIGGIGVYIGRVKVVTCQGHGFVDVGAKIPEIGVTLTPYNKRMRVVMP